MEVILMLILLQTKPTVVKEIHMRSMAECQEAVVRYNKEVRIYDTFPFRIAENLYSASCVEVPKP